MGKQINIKQWGESKNIIQKNRKKKPKKDGIKPIIGGIKKVSINEQKSVIGKINKRIINKKLKDLTGKRYNRWTVIEKIGKNKYGQILWKCECDCGTIRNVSGITLRNNLSKSCGCLVKEINGKRKSYRRLNLIRHRFGRLLVIRDAGHNKRLESIWECICECGNIKTIVGVSLIGGKTKSCGCLRKEISSKRTRLKLEGKDFGRLVVLSYEGTNKRGVSQWKCECKCGSIVIADSCRLKNGQKKSCGCLQKESYKKNAERNVILFRGPMGTGGFNKLYSDYKSKSKSRNYEFKLTKEQFRELTQQNCYYCDIEPKQIIKPRIKNRSDEYVKWSTYFYNGIDRKNNNIGYVIENCIPCCSRCNKMKMTLHVDDFLSSVKKIYNNRVIKI